MILKLGAGERQFVGMLSKPPSYAQTHAWLFCNPYGQEAVRAAPLYRVLSDRLASAGHAVLRFDYHGCGDSAGDFGDGSFEDLIADTLAAFAALHTYAPSASYSWFGLSLGANIAAMAAAEAPWAPERLVLWQPVTDGRGYCEQLLATHRKEIADELEEQWRNLTRLRRVAEPSLPGNVLGSDYGDKFAAQLRNLSSLPIATLLERGSEVRVATSAGSDELHDAAPSEKLLVVRTDSDLDWMTSAARSTALAPREVVSFVTEAK